MGSGGERQTQDWYKEHGIEVLLNLQKFLFEAYFCVKDVYMDFCFMTDSNHSFIFL